MKYGFALEGVCCNAGERKRQEEGGICWNWRQEVLQPFSLKEGVSEDSLFMLESMQETH